MGHKKVNDSVLISNGPFSYLRVVESVLYCFRLASLVNFGGSRLSLTLDFKNGKLEKKNF